MRILAIDTCFNAVSAAVGVRDDAGRWHVTEVFEAIGKGHAEKLMPLVIRVMAEGGLVFGALDRIAVTSGPGGFTGLRAGVAAARGFALATGKPLVAIGSLALIARGVHARLQPDQAGLPIAVAMDARKGEIYFQLFDGHDPHDFGHNLGTPVLITALDAATKLPTGSVIVAGSGTELLAEASGARRDMILMPDAVGHARDLVVAASTLNISGPVKPVYLRPPDAKPQSKSLIARQKS